MPPTLLEELRTRRSAARDARDAILTRAQTEQRDLSADELAEFTRLAGDERDVADEYDRRVAEELAEVRAALPRRARSAPPKRKG